MFARLFKPKPLPFPLPRSITPPVLTRKHSCTPPEDPFKGFGEAVDFYVLAHVFDKYPPSWKTILGSALGTGAAVVGLSYTGLFKKSSDPQSLAQGQTKHNNPPSPTMPPSMGNSY